MREKLLGTASYLASRKDQHALPSPLVLIFLFQPIHNTDPALKLTCNQLMRNQQHGAFGPLEISFAVLDIVGWNQRFHEYPARLI